jgi:malate dehydrogenase (oxaloacetate-decarboxylating)(NADP+)
MSKDRKQAALDYHALPTPGKIAVVSTKPCETQQDLSLAYSPGVAEPVREIAKDPEAAYRYTNKGNLVAVVSDGSAILGLGNRGALASKPVLEGKAVLFKRFANIDVFDIEIEAPDRDSFINTVTNIAPTFGGINLEDIAAPECFLIEEMLRARLDIPVFHDDQHATAVIVCAGLLNALELQGKDLPEARIVLQGAGAAGLATMKLLIELGAKRERMVLLDRQGVVHPGRPDLNIYKRRYAQVTDKRTLSDSMQDADVFIGVSAPNMVSPNMVASMAPKPVVFALANPDPEISPEVANGVRPDLIMATGRSDYPNQVNNVLVFPYVFRGALDVRASSVSRPMLVGAVRALANLAHAPVPAEVLRAYGLERLEFGPEYIIPKPLDPRLIEIVPPAVAKAAVDSGVARLGYPAHYSAPGK